MTRFSDVVHEKAVLSAMVALWRRERVMVALGALGLTLAAVCALVALANGGWLLAPEGRLLEAAKFNAALGTYLLSLALVLPLAGMRPKARGRWIGWTVGLTLFAFAMENVQAWRGLDPRFSRVAGPVDQALGGVFFLSALGVAALFFVLMARFFRAGLLPDHPSLRLALAYAAAAASLAFAVGVVMSVAGSRFINGAGNLMPLHAAAFHGLQALPLVALLLGWSRVPAATAVQRVHLAGLGWLALCAGLLLQAALGSDPTMPSIPMLIAGAGALVWAATLMVAWRANAASARSAAPLSA